MQKENWKLIKIILKLTFFVVQSSVFFNIVSLYFSTPKMLFPRWKDELLTHLKNMKKKYHVRLIIYND